MTNFKPERHVLRALFRQWLPLFVLMCLAVPALRAQFDTGTITGTITDSSGAVIGKAGIVVENLGTGSKTTVTADAIGNFTASGLPFGHYVVVASATGFGETRSGDINLTV